MYQEHRGLPSGQARPDLEAVGDELQRAVDAQVACDSLMTALTAAATRVGWAPTREAPLLGGGTVDLLINDPNSGAPGVGVVVAVRGATDALRRRLRWFAAHAEIGALVVITTRPRHRGLEGSDDIPTRVVLVGRGTGAHCLQSSALPNAAAAN